MINNVNSEGIILPYTGTYSPFSCDSQREKKEYFKALHHSILQLLCAI